MGKLEVGKRAPSFTLQDENGAKVALLELAGQWLVLYFYPKDDTPGCTVEACEFTSGLPNFDKLDALVVGCSRDTPETHRKFIAKYKLKIKLLSDPDHEVMEKYGAWGEKNNYGEKTMGVIRSTVLIDPAGRVAYHWPTVKAAGHAEQVRAKLAKLAA